MEKNSKILYVILISTFLSINFLGANAPVNPIKANGQEDNSVDVLTVPKSSGANVKSVWNSTLSSRANKVDISKNGEYIAAINYTGAKAGLTYFHRSSNVPLWNWSITGAEMIDLAMSDSGDYMAISNTNKAYLIGSSGAKIWEYPSFDTGVVNHYVDISDNGEKIVVLNGTGGIHLLDNTPSADKKPIFSLEPSSGVYSLAFSDNGDKIVFGDNNDIYVFNTTDYQDSYMWQYPSDDTILTAISSDGEYVAVVDDSGPTLYFFNTTDYQGTPMWQVQLPGTGSLGDLDVSGDGHVVVALNLVLSGELLGHVCLFNKTQSSNKLPLWNISLSDPGENHRANSVDFSSDGRYIVVGTTFAPGTGSFGITQLYDKNGRIWEGFNITTPGFISDSVAISYYGDYFIANKPDVGGTGKTIHLFWHEVTYPPGLILPRGDDDDDDDDEPIIPYGNYYLIFAIIGIISLVVIMKRRTKFKQN